MQNGENYLVSLNPLNGNIRVICRDFSIISVDGNWIRSDSSENEPQTFIPMISENVSAAIFKQACEAVDRQPQLLRIFEEMY